MVWSEGFFSLLKRLAGCFFTALWFSATPQMFWTEAAPATPRRTQAGWLGSVIGFPVWFSRVRAVAVLMRFRDLVQCAFTTPLHLGGIRFPRCLGNGGLCLSGKP
jgi:hypothetical protein